MNTKKMSRRRQRQQQLAMVAILASSGIISGETNAFSTTTTGSTTGLVRGVGESSTRLRLAYYANDDGYNERNGYNSNSNNNNNRNRRRSESRPPIDPRDNTNSNASQQYRSTNRPSSPQSSPSASSYDPRTSGYDAQQQPWPSESTFAFGTTNYDPYSPPPAGSQDYDAYSNNNDNDYSYGNGYAKDYDTYGHSYDTYSNTYDNTYSMSPRSNSDAYKIDDIQEYEVNGYRYSTATNRNKNPSDTNTNNNNNNDYYSRNSYNGNQVNYNYDSDYYRAIYQNQIYNRYDPSFFQANNADRTKQDFMWINVPQKKDLQTISGNLEYVSQTVETSVQDKLDRINDRVAETKYRWKAFLDLKDGDPYGRFCRMDDDDQREYDFSTLQDNLAYLNERAGDVQYRLQVVQEALQQAVEVPWKSRVRRKRKQTKQKIRQEDETSNTTTGRSNVQENNNTTQTKQDDSNAVLADWGSNNYSQWIRETTMNQPWDPQQPPPSPGGGVFGRLDGMGVELGMPLPDYYNNVQRTSMFRTARYKPPRRPSFETPTTMRSDPKSVRSTRQWQQLQKEQEEQVKKQQPKPKSTQEGRGRQEDFDDDDDNNFYERPQSRQPVSRESRMPSGANTGQGRRRPPNTVTRGDTTTATTNSNAADPGKRRIRRPASTVTLPDGVDNSNVMNGRRKRPPSTVSMGGGDNRSTQRRAPASSWSPQEQNSLMRNDQGQPFAMDSNAPRRQRQQPFNLNGSRPTTAKRNNRSGYDGAFDPQGQYGVRQQEPTYANQNEENRWQQSYGGYGSNLSPQIQGPQSSYDDWQPQRRSSQPSSRRQRQKWQQPDQQYGGQTQRNDYDMRFQQPQQSHDGNNRQYDPLSPQGNDTRQGQRAYPMWQPGTEQQQRSWPEQGFDYEQPQDINDSMWQQSQQQGQSYGAVSQQNPESQQNYYDEQQEGNVGSTWQPQQPY